MAHSVMNERTSLKETFMMLLNDSKANSDSVEHKTSVENDIVYSDMTRELCNVRIQEYISSQNQKYASEKGHASTSACVTHWYHYTPT